MTENPGTAEPVPGDPAGDAPVPPALHELGRNWLGFIMNAVLMPLAGVTCGLVLTGFGSELYTRVIAGVFTAVLAVMMAHTVITTPRDLRRWRERDRQFAEYLEKAKAYYGF